MRNNYASNEKIIPPSLPNIVVERRALSDALDIAAAERVVFVCAPGGYGKSVSVRLWLEASRRSSVWFRLDKYDNTLSVFYRLFCSGLLSIQPNNEAAEKILRDATFSSAPVEKSVELLSELLPDNTPRVLVFDDIHLITNPGIRKSLPLVLRRLPLSFVIIFISRENAEIERKSIDFAREVPHIYADMLAFSREEIKKHFSAFGRDISDSEAEVVLSETGGWPIGVGALAAAGRTETGGEGGRLLDTYVRELVWDRWDEGVRELLMKLSVVDELDSDLCRRLVDRDDSYDLLDGELRSSAFVTRTPDGMLRFHHLFLDFLRARVAESGLDTRELHRRAALCYIDSERYFRAWRHAVLSEDPDAIQKAAYSFKQYTNPSLDEYVGLYRTFDEKIPDEIMDRFPMLYTTPIWLSYLMGDSDSMAYYLDRMYKSMHIIAEKFPQFMENAMLVTSLDPRPSFLDLTDYLGDLLSSAQIQETPQGTTMTHWLPFFHRSNRDYCELADESALDRLYPVFSVLLKHNYDAVMRYISAAFKLERNRLTEAAATVAGDLKSGAMERLTASVSDEIAFGIFVFHAALEYAAGNPAKGKVWTACAENHIEAEGARYLYPNFLAFKLRMQMMDGSTNAAREWLGQYFVSVPDHFELYKIYQYFTSARAHITLGEVDEAMKYAEGIYRLASDFNRPLDMAEACVLRSVTEWHAGKHKNALDSLEEALAITQPYGFIRVVADEGAAVLPILRKLAIRADKSDYDGELAPDYLASVISAATKQSRKYRGIISQVLPSKLKLSEQQKNVVELLAQGLRNAEIASAMGITVFTVKSHKAVLYRKLRAANSEEAVARAKETGLID